MSKITYQSLSGSLIIQGKYRFYSSAMPIEVLGKTCFVTNRDEDPERGFQRVLDEKRADAIAEYIDDGEGTIPSSVILSVQDDADFEYDSGKKTIRFKVIPKAFLVLDGQHRVWGFKKAKTDLRVPVIIYSGLSRLEESRLFIDINTKQRPVPNELLLDIKKLADYESETEAYLGNLFDLFHKEKNSILKGKTSVAKRSEGMISRVTFNRAVKPILGVINDNDETKVYPILNAYLKAVALGCSQRNVPNGITSPIVLGAFMLLFPEIVSSLSDKYDKNQFSLDNFNEMLQPIFAGVRTATLKAPGKSSRILYEEFVKHLRNQKIKF